MVTWCERYFLWADLPHGPSSGSRQSSWMRHLDQVLKGYRSGSNDGRFGVVSGFPLGEPPYYAGTDEGWLIVTIWSPFSATELNSQLRELGLNEKMSRPPDYRPPLSLGWGVRAGMENDYGVHRDLLVGRVVIPYGGPCGTNWNTGVLTVRFRKFLRFIAVMRSKR